jgi:dTDP-4-amino-4,6-dideoxygalactose transaminase
VISRFIVEEGKKRSAEELAAARSKVRETLNRRVGESDEQFEARVIRTEAGRYSKSNRHKNTFRSQEEVKVARDKIRETLNRRVGESDEQFEKRVAKTESNSHRVNKTNIVKRSDEQLKVARDEVRKTMYKR